MIKMYEEIDSVEQIEGMINGLYARRDELIEIKKRREELLKEIGVDARVVKEIEKCDKDINKVKNDISGYLLRRRSIVRYLFGKYGSRIEILGFRVPQVQSDAMDKVRAIMSKTNTGLREREIAEMAGLKSATSQLNWMRTTGEVVSERGVWYKK